MFQALLVEPEVTVHVAECAGGVAGCAITWSGINGGNEWVFPQFVMFIRELVVGRAFQRRGVGRALVAAVEAAARLSGTEEIALFVDQSNTEAHAFYEALGLTAQSQYRHKLVRDVRRFDQQYNEIDLA